ncbi:MAG: glycosyltransferase [Pedobacter sp.]|nr:glycosyltransferase [Pedobacter sp.]
MEPYQLNNPAITVILPVYNGMKYLEQSVQSVLNQQFRNFEFFIIDDCSTEGSWAYLQSLTDQRVSIWRNEQNKGLFFNLNFLIRKSRGALIKLWSQDDVMEPDCIGEVCSFHERYPQIGFSYTDRKYIDAAGMSLNINKYDDTPELISTELHAHIAFITGSIAGNIANVTLCKAVLHKVGLFNEEMKISGDFEMWVRLAKDHPVGFLKKPLIHLRNHEEQLSGQAKYFIYHLREDIETYNILFNYVSPEMKKDGRLILRKRKLLFYYTLMLKSFFKGKWKTSYQFFKLLSKFDNIFLITWSYCKYKLILRNQ